MQMRSIKEILRVIDAREEEKKQAQKKLGYKTNFVDLEARDSFKAYKVTTSTIKCTYGYNHYGLRYTIINNNLIEAHCLRCNQVETWDHVVRCSETIEIRKEFILELLIELVKVNGNKVYINTIMAFGEDILRYLEYKDDDKEYEIS